MHIVVIKLRALIIQKDRLFRPKQMDKTMNVSHPRAGRRARLQRYPAPVIIVESRD